MANNSTSVDSTGLPAACFMKFRFFDPYDQNLPDTVHPTWTVLVAVNGLAAPPTITVNALIIWIIIRDGRLRSVPFNSLLVFLAFADFLVGLIVQPSFCLFLACILTRNWQMPVDCTFTVYFISLFFCCMLSMVALTVTCVERYLAIEHQTFYLEQITLTRVLMMVTFAWLIFASTITPITVLLNRSDDYYYLEKMPAFVGVLMKATVILYCSSKVQLTAYRQAKAIERQIASVQHPTHQRDEEKLKEFKKVFMMSVLVAVTGIFYMPSLIVTVIDIVKGNAFSQDFQFIAKLIEVTLIHIQSLINPIFMAFRLSYIRKNIKKLFSNEDQQQDEQH